MMREKGLGSGAGAFKVNLRHGVDPDNINASVCNFK